VRVTKTVSPMPQPLQTIMPEAEWSAHAPLVERIAHLKRERDAIVLAHNYMTPEIFHGVADITGDSLALARRAAETNASVIVMAGVHFMAETAKLCNPTRTVLIPDLRAGCSLAASITGADVRLLRERHPGVPVVTYVNTYAAVKAESDICCTSGNAVAVVESLKTDTVLFLPDEYLAKNVAQETGKHIIFPTKTPINNGHDNDLDYQMIGWHGRCEVHDKFTVRDITNVGRQFPDVVILAHPECSPEVVHAADFSGSTSRMIRFVEETSAPRYLLLTECSMGDNVAAAQPDKEMLRLCSVRCPHMNQITLEDTRDALRYTRYQIEVPEAIRLRAVQALERMLAIG
jgi:quinolinate synthase